LRLWKKRGRQLEIASVSSVPNSMSGGGADLTLAVELRVLILKVEMSFDGPNSIHAKIVPTEARFSFSSARQFLISAIGGVDFEK
jgi:hypothetical protein